MRNTWSRASPAIAPPCLPAATEHNLDQHAYCHMPLSLVPNATGHLCSNNWLPAPERNPRTLSQRVWEWNVTSAFRELSQHGGLEASLFRLHTQKSVPCFSIAPHLCLQPYLQFLGPDALWFNIARKWTSLLLVCRRVQEGLLPGCTHGGGAWSEGGKPKNPWINVSPSP